MTQVNETTTEQLNQGNPLNPDSGNEKLELILDIPVSVTVEIGRTKMTIRNLLQLNQGGIVALDRLAGDPLDVLVNGTLVAHGEVVVVNDKFGVRLTDIVSKAERIKRLK
ncbi:TPA: flagellar motor switch protein FliN [Legionella pneumophila subsp. pneumophila]|uniref:flagellar motor switch protein FliN n=1 Tax=Legionella pneumophila TaxID=446 RepID=UPI00077094C2|nr:flagellar motor switch protein FliN [Legionella pneumophila]HAT8965264.1 flagellar motor switch protein FliN [Legionella pneumophila subsp. pneumophila]CZG83418.1 Flagellar motor switch protein FliN [Legionella pneumophila]HAT1756570.1 flagellar motor switch protein FliN [Legionella pneumophila]HAT1759322.1 flagellar motor switch protein FliN [Legionella pneumophila]HAT1762939.1 flagellar motor switch protein FliN [Legionella pneumophila]